jgi:cyanate permease
LAADLSESTLSFIVEGFMDFLAKPYSISSPIFFFIYVSLLTFFLPTIELGNLQPLSKHLRKSFKHIIPISLAFVLIIFSIMVKQSAEPTPIYQGTLN